MKEGIKHGGRALLPALTLIAGVLTLPLVPRPLAADEIQLLNVSYDPTRELYQDGAEFDQIYKKR